MKLAINYSPQAATLLGQSEIEFDLYKCTHWPEMIEEAQKQRPAYTHFPLLAGRDDIDTLGWLTIDHALEITGTPYINTHLAPRASDFSVALDSTDQTEGERLYEAMIRDIVRLAERYGAEKVILENANWDPNYEVPQLVLNPDMITRVVEEIGCGLLLDLAHAHMSAAYLGVDTRDYISRLPVHRLRELHVTGTAYVEAEGRLVDHYPMTETDWSLAEWALGRIQTGDWALPWVVSLEYGGTGEHFAWRSRADVIARDLPRLHGLVEGVRV